MANFGSNSLYTALNNALPKNEGLTIEKAHTSGANPTDIVNTFPYGEYSLVNFAQVSKTFQALAQHIYANFIPNDRIIPKSNGATPFTDSNGTNTIFYRFQTTNGQESRVSTSGSDNDVPYELKNYLITGENLEQNIKFHKPKINGTQNYDENSSFQVITEAPANSPERARRKNNIYAYDANGNPDFYGAQISPDYKEPASPDFSSAEVDSTNKIITLKISNNFKKDNTGVSGDTDFYYTSFESDNYLYKHTVSVSSGGLLKSDTKAAQPINKLKVNNSDVTNHTFTVISNIDSSTGQIKTRTVQVEKNGLISSISDEITTDFQVVIGAGGSASKQTFYGVKKFNTGIELPSNQGGNAQITFS